MEGAGVPPARWEVSLCSLICNLREGRKVGASQRRVNLGLRSRAGGSPKAGRYNLLYQEQAALIGAGVTETSK